MDLPFRPVDGDHHYYEARDAFTRHLDPAMAKRCVQWAEIGGRQRILVGGKVDRFIPNPTFDPIARPGSLMPYFRARNDEGLDLKTMFGDLVPLAERPEYQDRDARLVDLDRQGLDAAVLFPTMGVGIQDSLRRDPEAIATTFTAFNRWLEDDWGYAYHDRLFAAPLITLADVDAAVAEVDRVVANGARLVCMTPGPVPTVGGGLQSPALPAYDPVWSRLAEAGITVAIHAGLSLTGAYVRIWEQAGSMEAFRHPSAFPMVAFHNRAIQDTMAALICHGLFTRHPTLRVLSVENGGMWVPRLFEDLAIGFGRMPWAFAEHPHETFRRHVWVSPFYEDDMDLLAELIGIERLVFGSDYPHAEGLAVPTDFPLDAPNFDEDDLRLVMRDNVLDLLTPR